MCPRSVRFSCCSKTAWSTGTIRGILKNEKYCGDVLMQKTYVTDCISKKVVRNTGQLPMVPIENHHDPIVSRDTFQAVQAELSRRSGTRAASQKTAPTGQSCYSSKYALTGNLICGECGTPYRRCVWTAGGTKRPVWRCISRLDYGTKYCHESPTIHEAPLQTAILAAINSVASDRDTLTSHITHAFRMELRTPTTALSLGDIDRRMQALNEEFQTLFAKARQEGGYTAYSAEFRRINDEITNLKQLQTQLMEQQMTDAIARERIHIANQALASVPAVLTEWDEVMIR